MQGVLPLFFVLVYSGMLFAFASWAEGKGSHRLKSAMRVPAYALALGVYCTSWTYYGAVGSAVAEGWSYVPIYLGPILVFVFGRAFLVKMVNAVKADGASSISEFIGGRFGSSRSVAAIVCLLALLGSIPYIALQLRSLSATYALLSGHNDLVFILCVAAGLLAFWAMLYGTRRYEASAKNDAVLFAVGFESLLKIAALLIVSAFAMTLLGTTPPERITKALAIMGETFDLSKINADFFIITLLSMTAIICLPRQFFMMVIEAQSGNDIDRARWPFVLYILATLIAVIPLAIAGIALLPTSSSPDLYVLNLPLTQGYNGLAILVFLGGFSAATAMVLVETIALSTMVSNDLVAPILLRRSNLLKTPNFGVIMLIVRRSTIFAIMLMALIWALIIPSQQRLASIGLISFAAMAQFAPVLILSVYRGNRDAFAAKLSLLTGLVVWFYTLALPQLLGTSFMAKLSGTILDPYRLGGIGELGPISHGAMWSLGLNLLVYVLATARRVQPRALPTLLRAANPQDLQAANVDELKTLVARFVGPELTRDAFVSAKSSGTISRSHARTAERLIASVVGLPSARALIGSKLFGARLSADEVSLLLDETGQSLRFSKGLLAATLEHIDPGVSVVDRELNIVAWNSRYLELFNYPSGLVYVGAPVDRLIRYNAERGECGPGEVEGHVARRLGHMKRGLAHSFERVRPDGRVIKTVGGPMPSGGYVMCFSDITAEAKALAELKRAQTELESRVQERTLELRQANLALAKADADKTRFLAAASHDLLQPIHAARLFSSAIAREIPHNAQGLARKLDLSIQSADTLLRTLLDISKLDAGGVTPVVERFSLKSLLEPLVETMMPLAAEKSLELRLFVKDEVVQTDRALLKSIVQNYVSNAIRYTQIGGVFVRVRQRGENVRIDVIDTGPGIAASDHARIFSEFERLPNAAEGGIGLGLAIVNRTARLLKAHISLASTIGRGSRFSVSLPSCQIAQTAPTETLITTKAKVGLGRAFKILLVDDNSANQEAMRAFLDGLGHTCVCIGNASDAAVYHGDFDLGLIDFNLGPGANGLDVIVALRHAHPKARFALVTAAPENTYRERAQTLNVDTFQKPIMLEKLETWIES